MEYFLGSIITLIILATSSLFLNRKKELLIDTPVVYTQSHIHNILVPFLPSNSQIKNMTRPNSQSIKFHKKIYIKILFIDNKAYWIKDNSFYVADIEDGNIIEESTQKVDIMAMNKVELDKMSFIVEKLTEGLSNDSGNSGKS